MLLLVFSNIFEIAFLLYNKARVEKSEQKRQNLKRLASTALITATNASELLPKPDTEDEYAAYSEAVASVLDSFEGEIAERAAHLLSELGIDAHYRRLARDRAWYKRGNAVDILASFRLKSNKEFFLAIFRSETSNDVKYRIIYGLSRLVREHRDILALAQMLSSLPYLTAKYTEDIFYNIISALKAAGKEEEFGLFMRDTMNDPGVLPLIKRDYLAACSAAVCEKGRKMLLGYYAAFPHEPEILIASIRALAGIGDFSQLPQALKHPDWRVRLAALKYSHLCYTDMIPEVRAMLRDPNYHVRINAALAFARAGDAGRAVLKAEESSDDRFAAAAAAYALSQEGL